MHDLDRTLQTLEPEAEYGTGEYELSPEIFGGPGSLYGSRPLSEEAETALAAELLAVTNEAELEQFMEEFASGNKPHTHRRPHHGHGRRRLRRHFRRYLKRRDDDAIQPVPIAAAVVAEPDEPTDDDQELESARRCVRLASAVAKKAAENPAAGPPAADPAAAAHGQAPGASPAGGAGAAHSPAGPYGAPAQSAQPQAGRWVRQGRNLILLGI
ncbi:MAG TPA: hypothetical protein VJA16_05240 [Thermoanaerobaculia bacterium]